MVHLPVVFGEWVENADTSWHFLMDKSKGGRMFVLREDCTHADLVQMAVEEYNIGNEWPVDLSYSYPKAMLKEMPLGTLPTNVVNDRQVSNLVELAQKYVIRLCVSTRVVMEHDYGFVSEDGTENGTDEDGDEEQFENDDKVDHKVEHKVNHKKKKEPVKEESDSDVDYSAYGKIIDSDEEEEAPRAAIIGLKGWKDGIHVKKSYPSKKELFEDIRTTALMKKFSYRVYKSKPHLVVVTCKVESCTWRVRAAVKNEGATFWVTKYVTVHTCSVADRSFNRKPCTPKFIAKLFIDHFGTIDGIVPDHIRESMMTLFTIKMSYTTSYRSLIYAQQIVRGTADAGYEKLPSYLHHLAKANPGTIHDLVIDNQNRFKYLFLAFGASIAGFQYLRRVIVVDGTHLNGKYDGVLLVAAGQDANFQVFPLAFGVVDIECDESWEWFFNNLKKCFSDKYPLTIASDRHSSIAKACEKVLPRASRGICYYHLQQNIISRYRGREIMYLVKGAAYAYTHEAYNKYMNDIQRASPSIARYLLKRIQDCGRECISMEIVTTSRQATSRNPLIPC